jgi:trehalose-6-phosphatase
LFLDYDGTISLIDLPKSASAVPPETFVALQKISLKIPVFIVNTNSLKFVVEKTRKHFSFLSKGKR